MLSAKELELVSNPEIILTKNAVIGKVYDLFGQLSEAYKTMLTDKDLLAIGPKIARGENYQGLPWVMLDFPRRFTAEDSFAIRSFFWWGHFFSITLHLSGTSKTHLLPLVQTLLQQAEWKEWFVGIGDDEWRHDFEADNYQPISAHQLQVVSQQNVFKLAIKIPLQEWDNVFDFYVSRFEQLVGLTSQTVK